MTTAGTGPQHRLRPQAGPAGLGPGARTSTTVTWTYDPLIRRNAFFNLTRLGARPVEYLVDFYGEMTDAINAGQGSDRLMLHWDLATELAAQCATRERAGADTTTGREKRCRTTTSATCRCQQTSSGCGPDDPAEARRVAAPGAGRARRPDVSRLVGRRPCPGTATTSSGESR